MSNTDPTRKPEMDPTRKPEVNPTRKPEMDPTRKPEVNPTRKPEVNPTKKPEVNPTRKPEVDPTKKPEVNPDAFVSNMCIDFTEMLNVIHIWWWTFITLTCNMPLITNCNIIFLIRTQVSFLNGWLGLVLWCLTPHSTIFQLYRGG
jgi:hypothetical protein